jgi:hypothetical protein
MECFPGKGDQQPGIDPPSLAGIRYAALEKYYLEKGVQHDYCLLFLIAM